MIDIPIYFVNIEEKVGLYVYISKGYVNMNIHARLREGVFAVGMEGGVLVKPSKLACVLCIMLQTDSKINDDYVMVDRPEAGKICHANPRTA